MDLYVTFIGTAASVPTAARGTAATLIARSTYWARRIPVEFDGEDELRRAAETGRLGRPTLRRDAAATEGGSDRSET